MKQEIIPTYNKIEKWLIENCGAKAIILVGSRAVGDFKENSDWDMYVISEMMKPEESSKDFETKVLKEIPKIEGNNLDITFLPLNIKYGWDAFGLKLRFSEITLDYNNIAKNLIDDAFKIYDKGPEKWTKYYALGRIEKAERYMKKFEDCLEKNNQNELFLRISFHFTENIIDWWYGIRQEWKLRPQQSFNYIKENDPEFYKYIEVISSDSDNKEKVKAFKEIHRILFNKDEFKELIN